MNQPAQQPVHELVGSVLYLCSALSMWAEAFKDMPADQIPSYVPDLLQSTAEELQRLVNVWDGEPDLPSA